MARCRQLQSRIPGPTTTSTTHNHHPTLYYSLAICCRSFNRAAQPCLNRYSQPQHPDSLPLAAGAVAVPCSRWLQHQHNCSLATAHPSAMNISYGCSGSCGCLLTEVSPIRCQACGCSCTTLAPGITNQAGTTSTHNHHTSSSYYIISDWAAAHISYQPSTRSLLALLLAYFCLTTCTYACIVLSADCTSSLCILRCAYDKSFRVKEYVGIE